MKTTPYEAIGGEQGVRRLVERFYDHMDQDSNAAHIRSLHAKSLRVSREKLFLFLSGWLGGPDLYVQKYGHPMLRRRHLPFSIGRQERDEWLTCMRRALEEVVAESQLRDQLMQAFASTADHMRNRPEHDADDGLRLFPGGFNPKGAKRTSGKSGTSD
jgi:hemoglobin